MKYKKNPSYMFLHTAIVFFEKFLHVMLLMNLSSLGMIVHLSHDTLLQNPTLSPSYFFNPWQVCYTTKEEHFLMAPNFHFFFSSAQHIYKVKTFLYHGYYNKQTQRALHHTNNYYRSKFLDTCSVFYWPTHSLGY